jgi:DNA gyrase subunit A
MGINICNELHQNFIDFSYEANSQRAFPSALDGLKPGQRACLWEFFTKGYNSNKPHVKSAKVAGGVIASWWPHGDTAIYETFARMSQPWINNIPEVSWHGNNGSQIAGPECASSRYTEARLSKAVEEGFFLNIKKNVVDMIPNFTEDDEWPSVFPAIFPRLYVNGSQGIGMTIANTWVPGNLNEFEEKVKEYLLKGDITYDNIYPDFPTGGIIINKDELINIYKTGKGRVVLRGKTSIENNSILIHELPYQVYVESFIDSIKELVNKEEIDGIKDIYNKSDKKRLLIEIECDKSPLVVLNKLFLMTDLQKVFSPNQYAIVSKVPQLMTLKDYVQVYVDHNIKCINREYNHDLEKAKSRLEIVEGLLKAIINIDEIIALIKQSASSSDACKNLIKSYSFTESQAKAIVDMKLGRLAHLEGVELTKEQSELKEIIKKCVTFLEDKNLQNNEFLSRLKTFVEKYGWARRTEVINNMPNAKSKEEKEIEFVEPEKCVVVMTEGGLIKRVPATSFKTQRRNGKGVKTQDDITSAVIRTNTIDSLMIFTDKGKMYRLLVNDIPVGTNTTKGQSIKSLVAMDADETPQVIYSIYRDTEAKYVLFTTKQGMIKKTALEEYIKTKKKTGIAAISLKDGDELASVTLIKDEPLVLITTNGMGIKFNSSEVSATSRATSGVKGVGLNDGDSVLTVLPIRNPEDKLALFVESGVAKKIALTDLVTQRRGGKGVIVYKPTATTGVVKGAVLVSDEDNLLVCGNTNSICVSASEIPTLSRTSVGNQILKGSKVVSVSKV